MNSPLDHLCPDCNARPGERCEGGPTHDRRKALNTSQRDTRYYDLDPSQLPEGHDNGHDTPPNHHHSRDSIPPHEGRQLAHRACVDELTRRGHPSPHQRASELLHHWLGN